MKELLSGNEAIARGAIEAGVQIATGYPGTPASEIIDTLGKIKPPGMYVEWSINEKVGFEIASAGSFSGLRTLFCTKHLGMNIISDALTVVALAGVDGGLMVVSADDPEPSSSQSAVDTRYYAQLSKILCIEPANGQEAKDMVIKGLELSEKLKLPVLLRTTPRIAHARFPVELNGIEPTIRRGEFKKDSSRYVMIAPNTKINHPKLNSKLENARTIFDDFEFNKLELKGKEIGIIASGVSYNYAVEAAEMLNMDSSILKLATTYPIPEKPIMDILNYCDCILVVEEIEPIIEKEVRTIASLNGIEKPIYGTLTKHIPRTGELNPDIVMQALAVILNLNSPAQLQAEKIKPRTPSLCAGCPHRATYYAINKALKDIGKEGIVCGDRGCYNQGVYPPLNAIDLCICMGSSIPMALGFKTANVDEPVIAIIGESTFYHAGMPGLLNAVHNKIPITIIIADNGITAMTGHQPNPSTGRTLMGDETKIIYPEKIAESFGVENIKVVDPFDLDSTINAIEEGIKSNTLALIVCRHPCPIELRREHKLEQKKVKVEGCTGCRLCIDELGCPGMEWKDGELAINGICIGCGLCTQICPFEAIKLE